MTTYDEPTTRSRNHPYGDDRKVSDLDFTRIGLLLMVIKEAVLHGPSFTNIIAEANFELMDINTQALEFSTSRAKAKADADAKVRADELARTEELTRAEEDKLRKEAQDKVDAEIKTKAQVAAAAQAKAEVDVKRKAEADAAAGRPVDAPVPGQPVPQSEFANKPNEPFIAPNSGPNATLGNDTIFTSDNGRRI